MDKVHISTRVGPREKPKVDLPSMASKMQKQKDEQNRIGVSECRTFFVEHYYK